MQRRGCKPCVVRCALRVASRLLSVAQSAVSREAWHTAVLPRASTSSSSTTWHAIALQHVHATRCNQPTRVQHSHPGAADESERDRPTRRRLLSGTSHGGLSACAGPSRCVVHAARRMLPWWVSHGAAHIAMGRATRRRGSFDFWRRCRRQAGTGYAHFARSVARIGDVVKIAHAKHRLGEHIRPRRVEDLRESPRARMDGWIDRSRQTDSTDRPCPPKDGPRSVRALTRYSLSVALSESPARSR